MHREKTIRPVNFLGPKHWSAHHQKVKSQEEFKLPALQVRLTDSQQALLAKAKQNYLLPICPSPTSQPILPLTQSQLQKRPT